MTKNSPVHQSSFEFTVSLSGETILEQVSKQCLKDISTKALSQFIAEAENEIEQRIRGVSK